MARRILDAVENVQVACDNCGTQLIPNAAYCEKCGARTRRARRLVRLSIRIELVFFLAVVLLVAGFVWVYAVQK
ncbi:MAG TPA: zinc ribbon domain-containing protein [Candidatus Dormibacteraeota bacterium]|nr:zinc ribbon domain-containing protein [Candidatus Dormibacteraeota bacterium]